MQLRRDFIWNDKRGRVTVCAPLVYLPLGKPLAIRHSLSKIVLDFQREQQGGFSPPGSGCGGLWAGESEPNQRWDVDAAPWITTHGPLGNSCRLFVHSCLLWPRRNALLNLG